MGVLVVEGADYAFRHSLMCEAVLAQLLPIERRELHERAARALAERAADDVVTAVAVSVHWEAAGMPAGRPTGVCGPRARPARSTRSPSRGATTSARWVPPAASDGAAAGARARGGRGRAARRRPGRGRGAARGGAADRRRSTTPSAPARWSGWAASSGRRGGRRGAGPPTPTAAEALGSEVTAVPRAGLGCAGPGGADHGRVRRGGRGWPTGRSRRPGSTAPPAVLADALTTRGTAAAILGDPVGLDVCSARASPSPATSRTASSCAAATRTSSSR